MSLQTTASLQHSIRWSRLLNCYLFGKPRVQEPFGSNLTWHRKNNVDHFVETNGVAALVGHSWGNISISSVVPTWYILRTELLMKVGTHLTENLVDPKTSHSQEPNQAPLNLAFNTNYSFYEWMNQPGNEFNRVRFDIAMHGTSQVDDSILRGSHLSRFVQVNPNTLCPNQGSLGKAYRTGPKLLTLVVAWARSCCLLQSSFPSSSLLFKTWTPSKQKRWVLTFDGLYTTLIFRNSFGAKVFQDQ